MSATFVDQKTTTCEERHSENIENLREYAQALIAATGNVKEEKVMESRNELIEAIGHGEEPGSNSSFTSNSSCFGRMAFDIGELVGYLRNQPPALPHRKVMESDPMETSVET